MSYHFWVTLLLCCENVFRTFSSMTKPHTPPVCKRTSCNIHAASKALNDVWARCDRFHWETGRFTLQTACLNLTDSQSHSRMSDSPTLKAENNEKLQQGSAHCTFGMFLYKAFLRSLKGGWVSYSCGCFSPMISSSCFGTPSLFTPGTPDSCGYGKSD